MKRRTILTAAGASALAGFAAAQSYPSRPIKYICPWPAGGSTDVVMRSLAESAGKALGQTVVVENKPGAGGMLGAIDMLNARSDGYTLCQIPHGAFRIPHMQKVAFDTLRDFTWIACLTGYTFGMVVQADSPFKSIKDVVDYARANPGKFSYGSTGTGTSPHLAVEEFALKAGVSLNHVPFKGNADNMQALLGGQVAPFIRIGGEVVELGLPLGVAMRDDQFPVAEEDRGPLVVRHVDRPGRGVRFRAGQDRPPAR